MEPRFSGFQFSDVFTGAINEVGGGVEGPLSTLNCRSCSPRLIGWFQSEAVAQGAWPLATSRPKLPFSIWPGCDRNGSVTGHRAET